MSLASPDPLEQHAAEPRLQVVPSTGSDVQGTWHSAVPEMREGGGLKSAGAALDVLGLLAQEPEMGVSDVARRLGIAKSTAHRLLTTLRSRGLVEPNPETGHYRLGLRLCELGNLARDRHPIRQAVLPHLVELRRASGMPVRVAVPDGADVVHVDHLSSSSAPAVLERLPCRMLLDRSGGGLAICAYNKDVAEERRQRGFGPGEAISSPAQFDDALEQTRRDGFAVRVDTAITGVTTIGSPIRDHLGVAYMAVGIAAPSSETDASVARLARLVVVASNRIARSALPFTTMGDPLLLPTPYR